MVKNPFIKIDFGFDEPNQFNMMRLGGEVVMILKG